MKSERKQKGREEKKSGIDSRGMEREEGERRREINVWKGRKEEQGKIRARHKARNVKGKEMYDARHVTEG